MRAIAGCLLMLFVATEADAEIVQWRATGYIDQQLAYPPGPGAPSGGPGFLDIRFTLDTDAPDLAPGDATQGVFASLIAVDIMVDGVPLSSYANWPGSWAGSFLANGDSRVTVFNDFASQGEFVDGIRISALDQLVVGGGGSEDQAPRNGFFLELLLFSDTPGSLLTGDSMLATGLDLSQFANPRFQISGNFNPSNLYFFGAPLESLAPVPLPAGLILLASGIALLGGTRRWNVTPGTTR